MNSGTNHVLYPIPERLPTSGSPPYAYYDDLFCKDELDFLQARADESVDTAIVGGGEHVPEIRRSVIRWVAHNKETDWLYNKVSLAVGILNADFYRFQISGFGECFQFTKYLSSNKGMYDWHMDSGRGFSRKLSVVIQLSHPGEYEGGELQLLTTANPAIVEKKRGRLVVFPSFTLHRVTPVTKGTRHSIVSWITGEPFR